MKPLPLILTAAVVLSGCGDDAAPLGGDSTALSPAGPPVKVTICHVDEDGERETRAVPDRAVDAHLAHGDAIGPCADVCAPEPYVDPDGCSPHLLERTPDMVVSDLRAARDAGDWTAFACNYHPDAFVIDNQGIMIGRAEIVSWAQTFVDLFDGATPTVSDELAFEDVVRNYFTLDGGWIVIPDGTNTYVVENGMDPVGVSGSTMPEGVPSVEQPNAVARSRSVKPTRRFIVLAFHHRDQSRRVRVRLNPTNIPLAAPTVCRRPSSSPGGPP